VAESTVTRLAREIANVDVGLDIFRDWLPEHGFKLILPPGKARSAVFASVWRRGEAHAVSHKGPTATLALLRAAESELLKFSDAATVAACSRCHGLGWFVTNTATIELCRHPVRTRYYVD
jgi:cytochrome c553